MTHPAPVQATPPQPFVDDSDFQLYVGDAIDVLRTLRDESVHCVVSSPPYWGLRSYLAEGHEDKPLELGAESTPEEYVVHMVEVFREVRRVLRKDGCCFLNLGSSYNGAGYSNNENTGGATRAQGGKQKHLYVSRGSGPSQSPSPERAPAYGSDGTEREDSRVSDFAGLDLCDGCRDAIRSHHGRNPRSAQPHEQDALSPLTTACKDAPPDSEPTPSVAAPLDAPASTKPRSSQPLPDECSHCANCDACLSVLRSSSRDARACARKAECRNGTESRESASRNQGRDASGLAWSNYTRTLKPKDLVPIPWMVAMALQADGWFLRAEIIWGKPNPMPESVTDRPTKSHEQVFLLTRSPRYYFDQEAIREGYTPDDRVKRVHDHDVSGGHDNYSAMNNGRERWAHSGRNARSVWTIATQPYAEAHFATFPEELPRRCIAAGTSERGCCPVCGAPWEREIVATGADNNRVREDVGDWIKHKGGNADGKRSLSGATYKPQRAATDEWRPTCTCAGAPGVSEIQNSDAAGQLSHGSAGAATAAPPSPVPCVVLDPFMGSGTVALVARKLSRRSVGIELNPDYAQLAARRLQQLSLLA